VDGKDPQVWLVLPRGRSDILFLVACEMIEFRCGRCERHGRLSVKRLLGQYGPDESVRR